MGRKECCPICGSKKIILSLDLTKTCKVCKYDWKGRGRKKAMKKGRTRFR